MHKKITLSLDASLYEALHAKVGRGHISQFISDLVRPYLENQALEASYREMAADGMREAHASEWTGALIADGWHETR